MHPLERTRRPSVQWRKYQRVGVSSQGGQRFHTLLDEEKIQPQDGMGQEGTEKTAHSKILKDSKGPMETE